MVKTIDELLNSFKELSGENISNENNVTFLEDLTDTCNSFAQKDDTDWKTKYEEEHKKYVERFFSGGTNPPPVKVKEEPTDNGSTITIADLFGKG